MAPVKLLLQLLPKAVAPAVLVAEIEAVDPETPPVDAVEAATVVAEVEIPAAAVLATVAEAEAEAPAAAPLTITGLAVVGVLAGLN